MIHLRSLAAFLRDICAACRPPADDLTALAEAVGVYVDDYGYQPDPTPLHDVIAARFAAIDAAVADFAYEVEALADVELAELIERGE